jgi:hypothetical protein
MFAQAFNKIGKQSAHLLVLLKENIATGFRLPKTVEMPD